MSIIHKKTKNFNVAGSSNGILVSFNAEDISQFPERITFVKDSLSLSFLSEDKDTKEIIFSLVTVPCKQAIALATKEKETVNCVFMIVYGEGKSNMKNFPLNNPYLH